MIRRIWFPALLALCACGRVGFEPIGWSEPRLVSAARGIASCQHAITARPDAPGYLVAWIEVPDGSREPELRAVVVDETGQRAGPIRTIEIVASPPERLIAVADADRYRLYTTAQGPGIDVYDLDLTGERVAFANGPGGEWGVASIVRTDRSELVVHQSGGFVYAAPIGTNGVPANLGRRLDPSAAQQAQPAATWSGTHVLVLFRDSRSGLRIRAVRVGIDGAPLGASTVVHDRSASQYAPQLVGPGPAVAAWWDEAARHALAFGVDAAGAPLWPEPVALGPPNRLESVFLTSTADDEHALIAWESDATDVLTQVYAARVPLGGSGVAETTRLTSPRHRWECPRAASSADGFAVTMIASIGETVGVFVTTRGSR